MQSHTTLPEESLAIEAASGAFAANDSGISWAAILAGASAAAALSMLLLILGFGLGFSAVSPWAYRGVSATTFGVTTIIWLVVTQILASGLGGYLAGRLRVKWASLHSHEVYFRDTAHGMLAWAVATLVTAVLLTSAIGSVLSSGVQASTSAAIVVPTAVAATTAANQGQDVNSNPIDYYVDSLLRGRQDASEPVNAATRASVMKIFGVSMLNGSLSGDDRQYLGRLVAQRSGLSQSDAENRVSAMYARFNQAISDAEAKTKQALDSARKAAAYASLWMFVALLCGAFCASLFATYGGKRRDQAVYIDNRRRAAAF
jgi:hypothetical protein